MAKFTLTLTGEADPDTVREAWESAVRAIRDDLDGTTPETQVLGGELEVDGATYDSDDVTDAADTDDATPTTSEETEP